ncbi:MAG: hypothetical protein U0324_06170 [Polyangiales bacterium]
MKTTRRGSAFGGVVMTALLCAGCPDGVNATDGGAEVPQDLQMDNPVDDLADATGDVAERDARRRDADGCRGCLETDIRLPTCVPGSSAACACEDGRMGAQVCRADGTFGACRCVTADAATDATPDVTLPPLGPRLITPQSVSRVTSQRPTMRWVLPEGGRARAGRTLRRPRLHPNDSTAGGEWNLVAANRRARAGRGVLASARVGGGRERGLDKRHLGVPGRPEGRADGHELRHAQRLQQRWV